MGWHQVDCLLFLYSQEQRMSLMRVSVARSRGLSTLVHQVLFSTEFMEFWMQMNQCLTQIRYVSSGSYPFFIFHWFILIYDSWLDVLLLQFNDSYSETKADAEKLVMRANGRDGLLTCCIRPSSLFGPGDKLLVPSLVAAARAGKSKVRTATCV